MQHTFSQLLTQPFVPEQQPFIIDTQQYNQPPPSNDDEDEANDDDNVDFEESPTKKMIPANPGGARKKRNKRAYTPETLSSEAPIAPEVGAEPERPTRRQKTPSSSQSSKEEQFQKLLVEFNEISDVTKAEHEEKK
ncbi:hypothetical protein L1987_45030 [Smallanthus sonchifolius]|uniref:Uncharacterized protein n=1 Tax=Smallanthus sonchifolius TaxID=185202 RepID=A0ACB9GQH9_9ASTR|nr:hypothetical protein L1987_45030 [Smallanthus sonchifolius]